MTAAPEYRPTAGIDSGLVPGDVAVAPPPAAYSTRRICPYLTVPDGAWRSSTPSRDHHCGAVEPPSLLADEKQRRLCLSDRHAGCSTFQVAAGRSAPETPIVVDARYDAPWPRDRRSASRASPDNRPGGETVTRWSIVRTGPVVLDQPRVPAAVASVRNHNTGRVAAAAVVAVVLVVLGAARLSTPGPEVLAGVDASASPVASQAAIAATPAAPRPTANAAPSATPGTTQAPATPTPPAETPSATGAATPAPAATATVTTYRVRDGDTLYGIAAKFGTSVRQIQALNRMGSSTLIHPGDELRVR